MRTRSIIAGIVIAVVIAGAWIGQHALVKRSAAQNPPLDFGTKEKLPDVTLTRAASGEEVSIRRALNNQPGVITFVMQACAICEKNLEDLSQIKKEMGDKFTLIVVRRRNQRAASTTPAYYSMETTDQNIVVLNDSQDALAEALHAFWMPETLFAAGSGVIRDQKQGLMQFEELRRRVERLIAQ